MKGDRAIDFSFPAAAVSEAAQAEKRCNNGLVSSLHLWFGRVTQVAPRAAMIMALSKPRDLPRNGKGLRAFLGLGKIGSNNAPPLRTFGPKIKVYDPFGGSGGCAMEAVRLGCSVTVNDLNPVAHLLQKCTLDFPVRYGSDICKDVLHWGQVVLGRTKQTLDQVYGPPELSSTLVGYWWTWEMECPHCGVFVPLAKRREFLRCLEDGAGILQPCIEDGMLKLSLRYEARKGRQPTEAPDTDSAGVACWACSRVIPRDLIRSAGCRGRLLRRILAVCERRDGRLRARLPGPEEQSRALNCATKLEQIAKALPGGLPEEALTVDKDNVRCPLFGLLRFVDLFLPRQLLVLGRLALETRKVISEMRQTGMQQDRVEAIAAYLALAVSRTAERGSQLCYWQPGTASVSSALMHYSLGFSYDFGEMNILGRQAGSYRLGLIRIVRTIRSLAATLDGVAENVACLNEDACHLAPGRFDLVIADPPYFDSIAYASLADYLHVWLRRVLYRSGVGLGAIFSGSLTPKPSELSLTRPVSGGPEDRHKKLRKATVRLHGNLRQALKPDGRLLLVFSSTSLTAWSIQAEALRSAGLRVISVFPIQTKRLDRPRSRPRRVSTCSMWLNCAARGSNQSVEFSKVAGRIRERVVTGRKAWRNWRFPIADREWYLLATTLIEYTRYREINDAGEPVSALNFLKRVRRTLILAKPRVQRC